MTEILKKKARQPTVKNDGFGHVYVRRKKTKAGEPGWWPETKRFEVVTTYLATGSLKMTSAMTGVPEETIKQWKWNSKWWKDVESEIQNAEDIELSAKLKKVVDKSLDVVVDRIENGDFQYDPRTGKLMRVPVKMRDTHKVLNEAIDKRLLLQKRPTKITEQQQTVDDRLAHLASQFAQFVSGKNNEKVIEAEVVEVVDNAVHDKWQARLQEGTLLGAHEEKESCEGQSGTEQSEVDVGT